MVHEIIKSKMGLFLEAGILTLLILICGFMIGFFVENYRQNIVIEDYKNFEVDALDLKLQNYYYQIMDSATCNESINQNLIFADKIYNRGLVIQKYEDAGELLKSSLLTEKKKYVLLQTELWLNSIILKKKCDNQFHTVVYIYTQTPDAITEAKQAAISKTLQEVKKDYENKIVLIPIAGDLNLDIVNLQRGIYKIDSLPAILIDENVTFFDFQSKETIETYLK